MEWMHVQIWFYKKSNFMIVPNLKDYISIMSYLENIAWQVDKRYFFLFESSPHLFMALEIPDYKQKARIRIIKRIAKPYPIKTVKFKLNTIDEDHLTDILHAGSKFVLANYKDNHKRSYLQGNPDKVIHCLCNQIFVTLGNECRFYHRRYSAMVARQKERGRRK